MKLPCLILVLATAAFGQGTLLWDESVNGPFSQSGSPPTNLGQLQSGTNTVLASVHFQPVGGGPGGILFSDYYAFTVGSDFLMANILLSATNKIAFWIGDANFSSELASVLNPTSGNLLSQLGLQSLPAGTYGVYVSNNELGSAPSSAFYQIDYFTQDVPEPGSISLLFVGLALLGYRFRKSWHPR